LTKNIIKTEKYRLFHQKIGFLVNFAAKSAPISLRYPNIIRTIALRYRNIVNISDAETNFGINSQKRWVMDTQ